MPNRDQVTDPVSKHDEPAPLRTPFAQQVHDALGHLYDPVYLQTHPLARLLQERGILRGPALGQAFRQAFLAAIAALAPDGSATDHDAGRGHTILTLRYVEALDVAAVLQRLAISRRQYYRAHQRAVAALVSLLHERWGMDCYVRTKADARPEPPLAPASAPTPLATLATRPLVELPLALSSFVGRARELAEVRQLLKTTRLLTLTGSGGIGKPQPAHYPYRWQVRS